MMRDQAGAPGEGARIIGSLNAQRAPQERAVSAAPETHPSATVIAPDPSMWGSAARTPEHPAGGAVKRLFDVLAASAAIVLLAPLLAIVWLAVRMEQRGEAIFKQERGGFNGQPFRIYKFRTMTVAENGADVRQVCARDDRITPLGGFLRTASWDELPQLFNVLKGDMSLIGPRPHAIEHDRLFSSIDPSYPLRFRARPGMTGLAQVSGCRGPTETDEKVQARTAYDVQYVAHWSFFKDLHIVIRTLALFMKRDPGAI